MWFRSLLIALLSGSTGASTATSTTRRIQSAGTQNPSPRCRRVFVPASARTTAAAPAPGVPNAASGDSSGMPESRIEHGIEQVDGEVREDVPGGDHEHHALHDEVVTRRDRDDEHAPDTGKSEQELDDHGAADERAHRDAGDGEQRERRRA